MVRKVNAVGRMPKRQVNSRVGISYPPPFTFILQVTCVLSCDATWKMIDGVYPELKSEQDEYRFKVEFRETELE